MSCPHQIIAYGACPVCGATLVAIIDAAVKDDRRSRDAMVRREAKEAMTRSLREWSVELSLLADEATAIAKRMEVLAQ